MTPTVTVVTAWRDCRELIPGYMDAMRAATPDIVSIYDTGSTEQLTIPEFGEAWNGTDIHLRGPREGFVGSFVAACNAGLNQWPGTNAVLWLNNDIRHTAPDWLDPIRGALRPGVLVGAQLRTEPHSDVDGRPHAYLDGWCLAGMRDDLIALGGLDENLQEPAYYSDNILCLRAKAAGMKLVAVDVPLEHIGNYTSRRDPGARDQASAHNRDLYLREARKLLG